MRARAPGTALAPSELLQPAAASSFSSDTISSRSFFVLYSSMKKRAPAPLLAGRERGALVRGSTVRAISPRAAPTSSWPLGPSPPGSYQGGLLVHSITFCCTRITPPATSARCNWQLGPPPAWTVLCVCVHAPCPPPICTHTARRATQPCAKLHASEWIRNPKPG